MRLRLGFLGVSLVTSACFLGAACNFGVDLDNLFGAPVTEGGTPDGPVDGGPPQPEAGIPSVEVQQLALGTEFGCGRRIDGTVMCWGVNGDSGELGDGTLTPSSQPLLVKDVNDAVDLAVGRHHGCVVRRSGAVSCWGENDSRQLGDGTTTSSRVPRNVLLINDADKVALGNAFSCALKKDKTVHCWGDNTEGQLGDGTNAPRSQPAPVKNVANVTQIVAASATACALVASGEVYCWGFNREGQLGGGKAIPTSSPDAVKVPTLSGIVSLGAGADGAHICGVGGGGDVKCWGYGGSGRLGNASSPETSPPVSAVGINDAIGVTANGGHTCAWRKTGVSCWGQNDWRQVGVGDNTPPGSLSSPVQVEGLAGIKQVAAGQVHTCALGGDGKHIWCWGANTWGALGRGTRVVADTPAKVATTAKVDRIGLGTEHGCLVDDKGGLLCWGYNGYRQQSTSAYLATGTPTPIPAVTGVSRFAGGELSSCALVGTQVRCWGHNDYGTLGNGQNRYIQDTPVVFNAPAASDVGVGYQFACALLAGSGDIMCSGRNDDGRLGRPGGDTNTPVLVQGTAPDPDAGADAAAPAYGATRLSVGNGHSCAIHGGKIGCWGSNNAGQLGFAGGASATPADVATITDATDVAAGGGHTCAVLGDQSLRCWGANANGQTTGGDSNGPALRTPNIGGKKAKGVACGYDHSCALAEDGTVYCWGRGRDGELGNGVRADSPTPVQVGGLANVKAITAKGRITCAVLQDGSAFCWGLNHVGQLGEGAVLTTGVVGPVVGY